MAGLCRSKCVFYVSSKLVNQLMLDRVFASCKQSVIANVRLATTYSPLHTPDNKPFIQHSPYRPVDIPENVPFAQYIMEKCTEYGNRTAFVDGSSGKEWSFHDIQWSMSRVGSALKKMGFQKDDVATIFSPNCPEFCVLFLGLAALGSVTSAVNPAYTADELTVALDKAGSKMVATVPALVNVTRQAVSRSKTCKSIVVFGEADGCRPFSDLLTDDGTAFPSSLDINTKEDLLTLPFSSGTTGLPKAVMLTHHNVTANIEQIRYDDTFGSTPDDTFIAVLPFYHIYGKVVIMFTGLLQGSKIVTMPKFDPENYLTLIEKHKATWLHIAPPLALFLAKHPLVDNYKLPHVKTLICGAAPLGEETAAQVVRRLGNICFRQAYGMTEASPVTHLNPTLDGVGQIKYSSVGYVAPNMLCKIVDTETGDTLGCDKNGEVCVKGPNVMKGYFNDEEATAACIKDGWLHTGDIGRIDKDGHTIIVDRLKEVIKYKGYQVAPAEIESLLLTHEGVLDSAVIGVPDDRAGEVPKAYIVLKPNNTVTAEQIHAYLEGKLASYKFLRGGIEFISEIPKSASGKLLRRQLKDMYLKKN